MTYTPSFECKYCGKWIEAQVSGNEGMLAPCDCEGARREWENQHRAEMERRKRARRKTGGISKKLRGK